MSIHPGFLILFIIAMIIVCSWIAYEYRLFKREKVRIKSVTVPANRDA